MLNKLLPNKHQFFDLFDSHTVRALDAGRAMHEALVGLPDSEEAIKRVETAEHDCDQITHDTIDLLRASFITPFDRNEIQRLITRLDDIVDYVEAAAHRLQLFKIREVPDDVVNLSKVLVKTQEQVVVMVKLLRTMKKNGTLHDHVKEINRLENESDLLHRHGIATLFENGGDPLMVLKLKDLYELLETAVDCCEDVAEVVEGIIIEHES